MEHGERMARRPLNHGVERTALVDGASPVIQRIEEIPAEFTDIVAEIAADLDGLYGTSAGDDYRARAPKLVEALIAQPAVCAMGAFDAKGRMGGLILGHVLDGLGRIALLHVREPCRGLGWEGALLRSLVPVLKAQPLEGVLFDCLPACPLDIAGAMTDLGFTRVPRLFMTASLDAPALQSGATAFTLPLEAHEFAQAGQVLAAAYENHPGRFLDRDVRTPADAERFIGFVSEGMYGSVRPAYLRRLTQGGVAAGLILGARAAPGVGFVLHVAVAPRFQGQGVGAALMRELAAVFQNDGLHKMALGVTVGNPARRLYERLGFESVREVDSYAWWRDVDSPG